MARDGYRIFDSDTHVGPDARILAGYLSSAEKDRLSGWEAYKSRDRSGHETYTKGQRRYRRRLGTAEPDETPSGYMAGFTGVKRCASHHCWWTVTLANASRTWITRVSTLT